MATTPAADHSAPDEATATRPVNVGVVSFLNTLPLIDGLDLCENLKLQRTVPALLIDELLSGAVDIALCSVIDYQRSPQPLRMVPVGLLGCHGETLTVRLYSKKPIEQITEVHADTDSHTSVALLQIVLHEMHGLTPTIVPYDAREHVARNKPIDWPETVLLIGDKVVTDSPPAVRYPHQIDLGAAWHSMTGLPFVFAIWMCREDCDPTAIRIAAAALDRQRRHNIERLDNMIHRHAANKGWPKDLAQRYLKQHLDYAVTDAHLDGMREFFRRAHALQLFDELRPLQFADDPNNE